MTRRSITLARDRGYYGKRRPLVWELRKSLLPYSIINFLDREFLSTSAFTFYGIESVGLCGVRTLLSKPKPSACFPRVNIKSLGLPQAPRFAISTQGMDEERRHALDSFKAKLLESREWEAKLKALRLDIKGLQKEFDHTEDNIKALQSVGQIIGEVLKQLDDERCKFRLGNVFSHTAVLIVTSSYRQSIIWPSICRRLQVKSGQGKVKAGYKSGT